MSAVQKGLEKINQSVIIHVLEYLKTGVFKNKTTNAYMIAYSEVHKLADDENDSSKVLFDHYLITIQNYMREAQQSLFKERGEKLIELFIKENTQCKILIHWMRKVFTYLDKFYTKNANIGTLCANGLKMYHNELFTPLKKLLFEAVDKMIENDRNCDVVDRSKIKNILRIFSEVDLKNPELYKKGDDLYWEGENTNISLNEWFKEEFHKDTENFINRKSNEEIQKLSAPEYIKSSLKYLAEEEGRKNEFIHQSFHGKLDTINHKFLIEQNCRRLAKMETGIRYMFKNDKSDELKMCFELISKHPESLKSITEEMDPYIRERGDELYNNRELAKDTTKFVPELIKLKKDLDLLVENSFYNHIFFQDTKNKAFSYFMNKEFYAKQLANFCDFEMKIGIKGNSDIQIEEKLLNIINVFKCLNNKLAFQIEYSKKLSDRLITNKTQSAIAEKNLISKLKAEAGVAYVNKMTSMMQDLESSRTEMELFKQQHHRGNPNGITFSVQVLQNGAWEIEKSKFDRVEIPPILSKCLDEFNTFYISRHRNHKLSWVYGLGNIEVQYLKLKKPYKSTSTLIQFLILLNLEKYGTISVTKIAELLGIKEETVANEATFLLYHPQFNPKKIKTGGLILSDAADGVDIEANNQIWVNPNFTLNSLILNTIPTKTRKKAGDDEEQEQKDAQNLRTYRNIIIDSTVTRIMKGRIGQKTTHVFLISEVSKQIEMFQAQPPQIKERIEALIEKQIIKRKDGDKSCYEYVA